MALTVIVRSGDVKSPPSITFDSPRVVIGRGDGNEVRLPDPSVSHRHASFRQRGNEWVVLDEGSTNGTFVGSVRLPPATPRAVKTGDLVRVGRVWLEVRIEPALPTQGAADATKEIALALVAEALAAQGEGVAATVRVAEGPDQGREMVITEFERRYVVGRGKNVDLTLDDDDASRRHAEIFRRGDHLYVRDLGSKNGTRLGELALEPEREVPWPRRETLHVGQNQLRFDDPVVDALDELERAADERVAAGEEIAPPVGKPAPELPGEGAGTSPGGAAAPGPQGKTSPIAQVPTRPTDEKKRAPRRRGWTTTDYVVGLVALAVLGLSVVGLFWLFRGP